MIEEYDNKFEKKKLIITKVKNYVEIRKKIIKLIGFNFI